MSTVKRVSPDEARRLLESGWTYVDVRSEPEFAAGRPAGSVNVPLLRAGPQGMTPNAEFLTTMEARFPKDARLVVGCAAGVRSLHAAQMLAAAGWRDVVDQRAGFDGARGAFGQVTEAGWAACGLPVERDR